MTPLPSPLQSPIAVAIAVGHCRCGRHQPSPPPSLSRCRQPLLLLLLLPSTLAIFVIVGHYQLPSPSAITVAMPLAISDSCCLGTARNVFNQLKQRMLTLFNFVRTVGGVLIEAGWLPRCQAAMANTSVGRWAASSEQLVREIPGSRGAAGGQQGGYVDWPWEVLFCLVVWVSAIDRWCLWWCVGCGRRHCQWDSDWTEARRK